MSDDVGIERQNDTASRLALAIGRLNRRMSTGGVGLSHGALSAVSTLVKYGPQRLGDLAVQERVAAATITRTVAALEIAALVRRTADQFDRRSSVIEATDAGTQLVLRARSGRAELMSSLLETLDAGEHRALAAALPALEKLVATNILEPTPEPVEGAR
jgi:DNA-binding MarR family transcriptional regulator